MGTLISTKDQVLFNCIAKEVNRLSGMYCYYYVLNKTESQRDPLYDEMSYKSFDNEPDGVKMHCFATKPEHALTTGEEGRRTQWDAQLWIARADWEESFGDTSPKHGDVVNLWGEFFDVVDRDRRGVMNDDKRVYMSWEISLRRMTKYDPIRRVENE